MTRWTAKLASAGVGGMATGVARGVAMHPVRGGADYQH